MACACNLDFKRLQKTKAAKHWTDDNQKNNRTEVKCSPLRKACIAYTVQTVKNIQNHAHLFSIILLDLPQ